MKRCDWLLFLYTFVMAGANFWAFYSLTNAGHSPGMALAVSMLLTVLTGRLVIWRLYPPRKKQSADQPTRQHEYYCPAIIGGPCECVPLLKFSNWPPKSKEEL